MPRVLLRFLPSPKDQLYLLEIGPDEATYLANLIGEHAIREESHQARFGRRLTLTHTWNRGRIIRRTAVNPTVRDAELGHPLSAFLAAPRGTPGSVGPLAYFVLPDDVVVGQADSSEDRVILEIDEETAQWCRDHGPIPTRYTPSIHLKQLEIWAGYGDATRPWRLVESDDAYTTLGARP